MRRKEERGDANLGHANTSILDGDGALLFVSADADPELGLALELLLVLKAEVTDLVEGITGIGDELTNEDILV